MLSEKFFHNSNKDKGVSSKFNTKFTNMHMNVYTFLKGHERNNEPTKRTVGILYSTKSIS